MLMPEREPEDCFSAFGLEYYLATEHLQKEPVFLFWNTPPTLMVGKYQNTLEEIDRDFADHLHGSRILAVHVHRARQRLDPLFRVPQAHPPEPEGPGCPRRAQRT